MISYRGEQGFDPRFGRGGVNGAGGNLGGLSANTTGAPVSYIPSNQVQTGIVPSDPMSQIGNAATFYGGPQLGNQGAIAHGEHTTDSFVNGIPRYFPGSHDPRQHNELRDPAGRPIPGTAPKDSEIPLAQQTGGMMPGQPGNMAFQVAGGSWLDPRTWISGEGDKKIDEARKGTFRAAPNQKKIGDGLLNRNSILQDAINNM